MDEIAHGLFILRVISAFSLRIADMKKCRYLRISQAVIRAHSVHTKNVHILFKRHMHPYALWGGALFNPYERWAGDPFTGPFGFKNGRCLFLPICMRACL